jgi:1-pyrroline-5-carboxylate dehydrogenase
MPKPTEFKNEALTDFSKPEHRKAQEEAIAFVRSRLGREYPILIGTRKIMTPEKITSINPAKKSEVIGVFQKGTADLALQALESAWQAFESWKRVPAEQRAEVAFKAAEIMRRRRFEVNAWMIFEIGKSWVEADADTAEAIDFLDFYGLEMLRYAAPQPITPVPGEKNALTYIPLGVGLSIPPWNFPMAILCGMTSAAWIAGNTVVLKPASITPMMGWVYMEIVREAGLPDGVVNFLSGPGGQVGNTLVQHPKTRFICFTGSKEVGLEINKEAATHRPGQIWIKSVVAEMGGKDSIIVDRETDIDTAVEGVTLSAFGFQGQKCSACSRAIVDGNYDAFVEKLAKRVAAITQGDPTDRRTTWAPSPKRRPFESIMRYSIPRSARRTAGSERRAGRRLDRLLHPTHRVRRRAARPSSRSRRSSARCWRSSARRITTTRCASRTTRSSASPARSTRRTRRSSSARARSSSSATST